jgi:DNA-binding transcriptional ArsR family regulator
MDANIAIPAALIGDPARAAILSALCDGRTQPASALAYAARVTPQSASNHLAKLLEGGLLAATIGWLRLKWRAPSKRSLTLPRRSARLMRP